MKKPSRTTSATLALAGGGLRQVSSVLLNFVSRSVFIYFLGAEYLGLNGLFTNILSFLSLAELGIGTAIVFYLYKPLADNDEAAVRSYMAFYKLCYRCIGLAILAIGLLLIPFLPHLVNFETELPVNLYLVYLLYLLNTASSYLFFAYKSAIMNASQKLYLLEGINISFVFANCLVDGLLLFLFRNYLLYLAGKFLMTLCKNLFISHKVDQLFPYLKAGKTQKLSPQQFQDIFRNSFSVVLFRFGTYLLGMVDNVVISVCLGTIYVGYYSNYTMVISGVTGIYYVVWTALRPSVGNINASEPLSKQRAVFDSLNLLNWWLLCFVCTSLFCLLTPFMTLWVGRLGGDAYVLSQSFCFLLVLSFFMERSISVVTLYRETKGEFASGRFLLLLAGAANLILSVLFAVPLGLNGVLLATVLCRAFLVMVPLSLSLIRKIFQQSGLSFVLRTFFQLLLFVASAALVRLGSLWIPQVTYLTFAYQILLCLLVPNLLFLLVHHRDPACRDLLLRGKSILCNLLHR